MTLRSTQDEYALVASKLREKTALNGISGLLGWDEMVMLPSSSSDSRGSQNAVLAGVIHDKATDATLGESLKRLSAAAAELTAVQNAVIRNALAEFIRTAAVPKELAQSMALLGTTGYDAWVDARTSANFSKFQSTLELWVEKNCEKANFIDPSKPVYDVLLQIYEKGMTSSRLDEIFTELRTGLVPLISELKSRGTPPDDSFLKGNFDTGKQAALCRQIAVDIGFDLTKGRLDVSVHPFTGGTHPTDVRMTTRFRSTDITEGLTGAIHETGHSLYEQGRNLDPEWRDLPVNEALSMGIHESQSLLWERMVALGLPFQHYLLPKIKEFFPEFPDITVDALYHAMNTIQDPSLIRIESDELTYTMHVILRYEIERGLVERTIRAEEVPAIWNTKMQEYLGVVPSNDAQGCLQDIHWSGGSIGYFPTYTLGAMYATQIYECARDQIPGLEESIAVGNFLPLKSWLNEHIHRMGSFYASGDELMVAVTGKPLDPKIYLRYLRAKYTKIYKI